MGMWLKLFELAPRMKEEGNEAYNNGNLKEAVDKYTQCVQLDPCNHAFNSVVYCNRSAVWLRQQNFKQAFEDCSLAIQFDSTNVKAYVRRSQAALELGKFVDATNDAEKACQLDKSNIDYQRHLQHCKMELKKSTRKNYYKILDVGNEIEEKELEKAFRKQAMKWHPDRFSAGTEEEQKAAEEKFKEIGEAYEVLKDSKLRYKYDQGYDLDEIKQGAGSRFSQGYLFVY
ncbi:dnaJ like protein, partial [Reticulomyxa filosa]